MLKTIFDLKTKKEDLVSANHGMANYQYDEVQPLRSIVDTNSSKSFPGSDITFRWDYPSNQWWLPDKAYIRIRLSITKSDGSVLTSSDDVAPAMGLAGNLFTNAQFTMNDKLVSDIDRHLGPIDALLTRMNRTREWMDSTGHELNFWKSDFRDRQVEVIDQGVQSSKLSVSLNDEAAGGGAGEVPSFLSIAGGSEHTIEFTAVNLIKFAIGAAAYDPPNLHKVMKVGDVVYINDGAEKKRLVTAISTTITPGDTLTVDGAVLTAVGAAAVAAQFRVQSVVVGVENRLEMCSRRVKDIELIWKPDCLSIFRINHAIPGGAKCELKLSPQPNNIFQLTAVQSLLSSKTATTDGANNDFDVSIKQMFLYIPRMEGSSIIDQKEYFLDLDELRLQTAEITSSGTQYSLDVPPSTNALTVAFQDGRAGSDTLYPVSNFRVGDGLEQNLTSLYVRYGGRQVKTPPYDPVYATGSNKDYMVEMYANNLLHLGGYYDSSSELLREWRERGIYIHFPWNKTGDDRESRVYVKPSFSSTPSTVYTPRLLLFSWFKKVAIVSMENGRVVDIKLSDA